MAKKKKKPERTAPTESNFSEAFAKQAEIMRIAADQLDRRGYCLLLQGMNNDARMNTFIYKFFSGAFVEFLEAWSISPKRKRTTPVFIYVFPETPATPFDGAMTFMTRIPNRQHYQIINVALDLISNTPDRNTRNGRSIIIQGKLLTKWEMADNIQYRGQGKKALRALLQVLEIPNHKTILMTGDSNA